MPEKGQKAKSAAAVPSHDSNTPALSRAQKLPTRPSLNRTKPPGKQTRYKKTNPNADIVFNHRARFSRFKRRIHAQRRWVVESHTNKKAEDLKQAENENAVISSRTSSSSHSDTETQWESPVEVASTATKARTSSATTAATERVAHAVDVMDALFDRMDLAMKQRRFGRAAFLRRCLRARQHELRRELLTAKHRSTATAERTNAAAVPADASPSAYRSFHPPSTWLGVGRHPRSEWVDQRSGRHPKACTTEQIHFVLRNFLDDIAPHKENLAPDVWAYQLPPSTASPPPPTHNKGKAQSSADHTPVSATCGAPATALTRSQRQLKASLFVASYCTNIVTDTLDDLSFTLLQGLYKEQRDLKQKQPLQFKARQRYVVGFQEVLKCLKAGRVKLVLLAADIESVDVPEAAVTETKATGTEAPAHPATKRTRKKAFQSLYEAVEQVQHLCGATQPLSDAAATPSSAAEGAAVAPPTRTPPLCLTCMSRHRLAYALFAKGSKVACVGVMQAEKNRDALKAVMACGRLLTQTYTRGILDAA